jgi:uncharacterized protein YqeY
MKSKLKLSAFTMSLMMAAMSLFAVSSQSVNASENVNKSASASVTEKAKEVSDEKESADEDKLENMCQKDIDNYMDELKKKDDVKKYVKAMHERYGLAELGKGLLNLMMTGAGACALAEVSKLAAPFVGQFCTGTVIFYAMLMVAAI